MLTPNDHLSYSDIGMFDFLFVQLSFKTGIKPKNSIFALDKDTVYF